MSWTGQMVDGDGNVRSCSLCNHVACCQVPKLVDALAYTLTSVDVGCAGHMASGTARLECSGFEPVEPALVDASGEGTDAADGGEDKPE